MFKTPKIVHTSPLDNMHMTTHSEIWFGACNDQYHTAKHKTLKLCGHSWLVNWEKQLRQRWEFNESNINERQSECEGVHKGHVRIMKSGFILFFLEEIF